MAYSNEGQFESGKNIDKTWTNKFLIQIQFADKSVDEVRTEIKRIYEHFTVHDGAKLCINIFMILHKKDLDKCSNNHVHILLQVNRTMRLITMLNYISKVFEYNPFAISIDRCVLQYASLRYFLHLDGNTSGKFVYSLNDITTNVSDALLRTYIDSEDDTLTAERLKRICYDCQFRLDKIMEMLGLQVFHKWIQEIKIICDKEFAVSKEMIDDDKRELDNMLPF